MFLSEIVVYLMVGFFCALAVRSPFYGLLGYYLLSFLRPQDIYWYAMAGSRLSYYVAVITIASFFFHLRGRDSSVPIKNGFVWFFVLFWLAAFNSYLMTRDQELSYPFFLLLSKLMLMAVITVCVVDRIGRLRALFWMMVISLGLLALRTNYQYFFEGIWFAESPGQPGAPGRMDNNGYAMQFVMIIPVAFFLFFTEGGSIWLKGAFPAAIPFMIHTVILTYSRGGFLGMMLVLANCVLFLKKRKWAILAGLLLFGAVVRLQGDVSKERLKTIYEYEEDPSVVSRFEAWRAAWSMMMGNKWSGVGIGNFESRSLEYNPALPKSLVAHNAFLHIGAEMGIASALLYIGVLALLFWRLQQMGRFYKPSAHESPHYYYTVALRSAFAGYVFCAMFLSLSYLELYYLLVAISAAFYNIYRRDRMQRENPNQA